MRRGICGSYIYDLGLLSNFKSVRIRGLFKLKALLRVSTIRSGPFLVSRTGDEGFNLTLSS